MAESHSTASKLEAVRVLLDQIVQDHPDTHEAVDQIHKLLDGLPGTRRRSVQRRTGEGVRYEVRTVNKRALLYEVRPAGAPLRVGRDLFDAMVELLAAANKPMSYDELAEGAEAKTGADLADWQGRVLIRFLQQADPPIVIRERSRYRAVDPSKFAAAARRLWTSTAKT